MKQQSYEDIMNLERPISSKHTRMSLLERAAQFAPFAALTGHKEAIAETARVTTQKVQLDENSKEFLDRKLQMLMGMLQKGQHPLVKITYFLPDLLKTGGSYEVITGKIKKVDTYREVFVMMDARTIPVKDIVFLESQAFDL